MRFFSKVDFCYPVPLDQRLTDCNGENAMNIAGGVSLPRPNGFPSLQCDMPHQRPGKLSPSPELCCWTAGVALDLLYCGETDCKYCTMLCPSKTTSWRPHACGASIWRNKDKLCVTMPQSMEESLAVAEQSFISLRLVAWRARKLATNSLNSRSPMSHCLRPLNPRLLLRTAWVKSLSAAGLRLKQN